MADKVERAQTDHDPKAINRHETADFQQAPGEAEAARNAVVAGDRAGVTDLPSRLKHMDGVTRAYVVSRLQQDRGNREVGRMLAQRATLLTGHAVQRDRPRSGPAVVGGSPGTVTFLPGPSGEVLAPGEAGYSREMLRGAGEASEALLATGDYQAMRLHPMEMPSFAALDQQKRQQSHRAVGFRRQAEDFFNTPSTTRFYNQRADYCETWITNAERTQGEEQNKIATFNGWASNANGFYTSFARLDAMARILGVNDPAGMAAALTAGLSDAQAIARRAQLAADRGRAADLPVPPSADTVTSAAQELNQAQNEMSTAYRGFQMALNIERAQQVSAEGEEARRRLQEINEIKQFLKNVGKTIDITMLIVGKAPEKISNATLQVNRAQATLNAARNRRQIIAGQRPTHNPTYTTINDKGEVIVHNMQTQEDRNLISGERTPMPESHVELPTSVESLLGTIGDFIYASEIRELNNKLQEIQNRVTAIQKANEFQDLLQKTQNFRDKLNNYALKAAALERRIQQRREDYLNFGRQLDNFARQDAESRRSGQAPGRGEERYATIMTMVAGVREALAVGNGAKNGFDSPAGLDNFVQNMADQREPYRLTQEEIGTFRVMYGQLSRFHRQVESMTRTFAQVEAQADQLMALMHPGGGGGAY